jgi:hypothetical protein
MDYDFDGTHGGYFSDTLDFGDFKMNKTIMALVEDEDVDQLYLATLGLGWPALEADVINGGNKTHPTVLDHVVDQGLIKTRAYSLWLDRQGATAGKILFGGFDNALYTEPMWSLDMQSPDRGFFIALTGLSLGNNASDMETSGFKEPLPALISTA